MHARSLWSLTLAALMALAMAACGDATLSSDSLTPSFDDTGRTARPADGGGGGGGIDDDGGGFPEDEPFTPDPEDLTCVLIPSVGGDVFVGVESAVQIGVYQFSLETGEPMADQRVTFQILEDESDARLSSERVRTDTDGLGAVRLNAGVVSGTITVRAFSDCANSLDIEVDILELPTGNVMVRFNYPFRDIYDVSPLRVDVFLADELRCSDIAPGELPADPLVTLETGSTLGTLTFNALLAETPYTFIATGYGEHGERAAQGCADNVVPREGRTTEQTIDLFLLPLNPAGDYDVLSFWDFRDAIAESGEVGRLIVDVLDIFEDPGRGIVDFILDLVEDFVGGIISAGIRFFLDLTGLDDVIGDGINDLIESSPLLSDIVTIGRDLRAIIAELEVISDLNIGKLGSDFEVFGVDHWIGISLYWRLDCEPEDPPDCGRLPIVLDSVDLGLLRGEWTGRVLGYNRLDIDRHPVDFEYGRLILYVLEHLVLPAITGDPAPVTLEDLMAAIINCDAIGDFVGGGDGDCRCALGACICDDDVEGFCRSFISFTFGGLFRSFVDALSFDAVLEIRGSVDLINTDDNLDVDELRDGQYVGNINIGGSPTPFVAGFCGIRQGTGDVVEACFGETFGEREGDTP